MTFKETHDLEWRKKEAQKVLDKYAHTVPVILEGSGEFNKKYTIRNNKLIVPDELTFGQLLYTIRKQVNIKPDEAFFVYINKQLISVSTPIINIYRDNADEDKFLYLILTIESTFG